MVEGMWSSGRPTESRNWRISLQISESLLSLRLFLNREMAELGNIEIQSNQGEREKVERENLVLVLVVEVVVVV